MKEAPRARFRVATYNVHDCVGMDRQRSETRIAAVIAELAVDLNSLPGSRPHQNLCRHLRDVRPLIRLAPLPHLSYFTSRLRGRSHFPECRSRAGKSERSLHALARMASDHFPLVAELMVR
jgi:endonuclease/exonuclease/phosphatase family metal-dependent hydrolase